MDASLLKPATPSPRTEATGDGLVQPRRSDSARDAGRDSGAFARELESGTRSPAPKRDEQRPVDSAQARKPQSETRQNSRLALVARQSSPALNVLTAAPGKMPSPEVASQAARSEFIQGAISSPEINKFLATPVAVESLVRDLGLAPGFMSELKALGMNEGQIIAPKDLLNQLGIDVGQVSASLQDLKSKVHAAEKSLAAQGVTGFDLAPQDKDPKTKKLRDLAAAGAAGLTMSAPGTQPAGNENARTEAGTQPVQAVLPQKTAKTQGATEIPLSSGPAQGPGVAPMAGKSISLGADSLKADSLGSGSLASGALVSGALKAGVSAPNGQAASTLGSAAIGVNPSLGTPAQNPSQQILSQQHSRPLGEGTFTSVDPWQQIKLGSNVQRTDFSAVESSAASGRDPLESLIRSQMYTKDQSLSQAATAPVASMGMDIQGVGMTEPVRGVDPITTDVAATGLASLHEPSSVALPTFKQDPAALKTDVVAKVASADVRLPEAVSTKSEKSETVDMASEQKFDLRDILTPQNSKTTGQTSGLNPVDLMDRLDASLRLSGRGVEGLLEKHAGSGSEQFLDESGDDLLGTEISLESGSAHDAGVSGRVDFASIMNPQASVVDGPSGQPLALADENRAEILQKLVDKAQMVVKEGGGSVRIDLGSPEMGRLELAVNLNQDRVDLRIVTASEHIRDMLSREMPKLRESLAVQNLNLGSVEVGVGGGQHQFSQSFSGQQGQPSWAGSQNGNWQGGGWQGRGFEGQRREAPQRQVIQGIGRISRIPVQMTPTPVMSGPGRIQVFA